MSYNTMKQFKISDEKIKEMYLNGNSIQDIANIAQDTKGLMALRKKLHSLGIDTTKNMSRYSKKLSRVRRIYGLNESVFDSIDNSDKAYWLGFLYADGYNRENRYRISIVLQKSDIDHLYKFQNFLSCEIPVKCYTSNNYQSVVLGITSMHLSKSLAKLGCVQAKTHIRQYPNISDEFNRDFIRGYFDGNGSFSHNKEKGSWQISITGNNDLIISIQKILEREVILNHTKINYYKGKKSIALHYIGRRICQKILSYLYDNANTFLNRKFDKYSILYLGTEMCNNNKSREFMENPTSLAEDNHEPSLNNEEGATTIPKGSTPKWVEVRDSKKLDDDIV